VIGLAALYACIVALAFAWFLRAFCLRWLGGVTGDLIGAAGEIVETAVIVAVTL
jgi:cobalamin synthase